MRIAGQALAAAGIGTGVSASDTELAQLIGSLVPASRDPRDYQVEPGLWRSEILPLGVSIDQAIHEGLWNRPDPNEIASQIAWLRAQQGRA